MAIEGCKRHHVRRRGFWVHGLCATEVAAVIQWEGVTSQFGGRTSGTGLLWYCRIRRLGAVGTETGREDISAAFNIFVPFVTPGDEADSMRTWSARWSHPKSDAQSGQARSVLPVCRSSHSMPWYQMDGLVFPYLLSSSIGSLHCPDSL